MAAISVARRFLLGSHSRFTATRHAMDQLSSRWWTVPLRQSRGRRSGAFPREAGPHVKLLGSCER
jgi:hypothetical protein